MTKEKIKIYCCDEFEKNLGCGAFTVYPEGNISISNDYTDIDILYCPFCGKKLRLKDN